MLTVPASRSEIGVIVNLDILPGHAEADKNDLVSFLPAEVRKEVDRADHVGVLPSRIASKDKTVSPAASVEPVVPVPAENLVVALNGTRMRKQ